jgi:hypothetical protein
MSGMFYQNGFKMLLLSNQFVLVGATNLDQFSSRQEIKIYLQTKTLKIKFQQVLKINGLLIQEGK